MDPQKIEAKMARYHNGIYYTCTINPDDHLQFKSGMNRWTYVRQSTIAFMSLYRAQIEDIELYPDISYPPALRAGVYPRIHYHGVIKFKDVMTFLTNWDPRARFSVEIDTISDKKAWNLYIKKLVKLHPAKDMYRITLVNLEDHKDDSIPTEKMNIVEMCKQHSSGSSSEYVSASESSDSE